MVWDDDERGRTYVEAPHSAISPRIAVQELLLLSSSRENGRSGGGGGGGGIQASSFALPTKPGANPTPVIKASSLPSVLFCLLQLSLTLSLPALPRPLPSLPPASHTTTYIHPGERRQSFICHFCTLPYPSPPHPTPPPPPPPHGHVGGRRDVRGSVLRELTRPVEWSSGRGRRWDCERGGGEERIGLLGSSSSPSGALRASSFLLAVV